MDTSTHLLIPQVPKHHHKKKIKRIKILPVNKYYENSLDQFNILLCRKQTNQKYLTFLCNKIQDFLTSQVYDINITRIIKKTLESIVVTNDFNSYENLQLSNIISLPVNLWQHNLQNSLQFTSKTIFYYATRFLLYFSRLCLCIQYLISTVKMFTGLDFRRWIFPRK